MKLPIPMNLLSDLVQRLANAKADLVAARAVGPAIVIAADTVVVLDGQILGKPRSNDDAHQMLSKLSGRTHSVLPEWPWFVFLTLSAANL